MNACRPLYIVYKIIFKYIKMNQIIYKYRLRIIKTKTNSSVQHQFKWEGIHISKFYHRIRKIDEIQEKDGTDKYII